MSTLEVNIHNKFQVITDKYWLDNYKISFGVNWRESSKQYVGQLNITEPVTTDELKKMMSP